MLLVALRVARARARGSSAAGPAGGVTPAIILAVLRQPGEMILPVVLSACGLVYAYFGVVLRYQADLQSFVAHARLAETQASLAELNRELVRRVEVQVAEIVRRADDVDALNAQLREKVQVRSRELARALRGLNHRGDGDALAAGAVLGGVIESTIGAGGMGTVYVGQDRVSGRRVAVKVMSAGVLAGPRSIQRFLAEAEAAAAIAHPGIVKTLDRQHPRELLAVDPSVLACAELGVRGVAQAFAGEGQQQREMSPRLDGDHRLAGDDPQLDVFLVAADREPQFGAVEAPGHVLGAGLPDLAGQRDPPRAPAGDDQVTVRDLAELGGRLYHPASVPVEVERVGRGVVVAAWHRPDGIDRPRRRRRARPPDRAQTASRREFARPRRRSPLRLPRSRTVHRMPFHASSACKPEIRPPSRRS